MVAQESLNVSEDCEFSIEKHIQNINEIGNTKKEIENKIDYEAFWFSYKMPISNFIAQVILKQLEDVTNDEFNNKTITFSIPNSNTFCCNVTFAIENLSDYEHAKLFVKLNKLILKKYATRLNDDENIFNRVFAVKFKDWHKLGYGKSVYHASPFFQIGHHNPAGTYKIEKKY